jgi:DNA-directed RNA polymerase sigma subunit (sigma70/sigma32)
MEQRLAQSDLSLDMPVRDEADSATLGDLMAAPGESVESEVSKRRIHESFRTHVERFSFRSLETNSV